MTPDTPQLPFNERAEGEQLKQEGMDRVSANVDAEWRKRADEAIRHLALSGKRFTADDVRHEVGDPPSGKVNAMGARFSAAAKAEHIVAVGSALGTRKQQHARRLTVWKGTGTMTEAELAEAWG